MRRLVAIAVLGILLLGAGAIAIIYLGGEGSPPAPSQQVEVAVPATAPPSVPFAPPVEPAPPVPDHPGRAADSAPVAAPGAQVSAPPPPMPADPGDRADRQLEIRKERRNSALEQMYAREAARRQRLGLPPAPPPPTSPPPGPSQD